MLIIVSLFPSRFYLYMVAKILRDLLHHIQQLYYFNVLVHHLEYFFHKIVKLVGLTHNRVKHEHKSSCNITKKGCKWVKLSYKLMFILQIFGVKLSSCHKSIFCRYYPIFSMCFRSKLIKSTHIHYTSINILVGKQITRRKITTIVKLGLMTEPRRHLEYLVSHFPNLY